jgi:lysozyme
VRDARPRWLWIPAALVLIGSALAFVRFGTPLTEKARALLAARPSRERYPVVGVDVSHHQGRIDWAAVAQSGVSFAFVKASEGTDFRDRRFSQNWQAARAAGIVVGAYHFFTFCSEGREQARHFRSVVPAEPGALPPAVDVEFAGNCRSWTSEAQIQAELVAFVAEIERTFGRSPVLYTTEDAFRRVIPPELHDRRFWLRDLFGEPASPTGRFWIWQYSDSGSIPGIRGPVDLNVFGGSTAEWSAWADTP